MLFNSFEFFVLVVLTWGLYYLPAMRRWQVELLIVSSLVFYSWTNPKLLLLFLGSAAINVSTSYGVVHGPPARRRFYATLGVVLNLLILAFFKYSPLLGRSLFHETNSIGQFLLQVPLPIGISFYTFEGISLLVDAYQGREAHAEQDLVPRQWGRHLRNTTFFVAFFPHLIAGPILKAHQFIPQIVPKRLAEVRWEEVARNLVLGYFLKMVLADNLKEQTFWLASPYFESLGTPQLLAMLFGYSMQIFADFAGYSLIAIGVARMFGYNLPDNFNFPYISQSVTEFWRRWHISLSSFLREYLYVPLGGNRRGNLRTYLNLLIVMFLGGLWHGAAWSYAVWGTFHGVALALERLVKPHLPAATSRWAQAGAMLLTFTFVSLAWLLFKLPDFSQAVSYVTHIFTNGGVPTSGLGYLNMACIAVYSLPVLLYHAWYLARTAGWELRVRRYDFVGYGLMLFLITTNAGPAGDFIYFQF